MSQYFLELYEHSGANEKFDHWYMYAGIKQDNLDVDKIKTASSDLSKLSNVVDNYVIKKNVYDKLIIKLMLFILMY